MLKMFKVRSEAPVDMVRFANFLGAKIQDIEADSQENFSFRSRQSLDFLVSVANRLPDCHVIARTLEEVK